MQVGDVLGERYRIVRRIASGGMGTVWEAVDTVLAQTVALKHVTFDGQSPTLAAQSRLRTQREARNAARLRGEPDIIAIYDVFEADGGVWLVLEYLPSASLGDVLDRVGRLPVAEVARIGATVADALAAAHRRGVVHRDVKPRNVLIADRDGRVKLTDFGISYAEGEAPVTESLALTGTPAYMAREVAAGEDSTAASDVFSLASTLYRAVEGVAPFGEDDNPRRLVHRVASGLLRPPETAGPLTGLLLRMFDERPDRRPPAATIAAELRDMASTPPTDRMPQPPPQPPPPPHRPPGPTPPGPATPGRPRPRRRTVLIAAAVGLVALVAAGGVVVPRLGGGITDLEPLTEMAVPADAARPAGTGRAVCSGPAIAFAGARTGENAGLGQNEENGVALAVTQHNRANPRCQVGLQRFDTGGTVDTAPAAIARLVARPEVVGAVGLPFSGESRATGTAFEQAGLAHLTPSATNPELARSGWSTFFRMLGDDTVQAPAAARLLTDRLGARRVCVVRDDSDYAGSIAPVVEQAFGETAVPDCLGRVVTNQTDMTAVVDRVLAADADAVFYAGYYQEAAPLDRQLVDKGFRGRFVGTDGVKDDGFALAAGPAASNAYVLCPCAPSELATGFAADYAEATGAGAGTYSLEAYDAATALLAAIDAGNTDRASVKRYLAGLDTTGFSKRLRWSDTGEPESPPVFAYRVVNGRLAYVGPVN